MTIIALGYLGIHSRQLEDSLSTARLGLIGMMPSTRRERCACSAWTSKQRLYVTRRTRRPSRLHGSGKPTARRDGSDGGAAGGDGVAVRRGTRRGGRASCRRTHRLRPIRRKPPRAVFRGAELPKAVPAGAADFRLSTGLARHGSRRAQRRRRRGPDAGLPRHPRLPSLRFRAHAVWALFLPRQRASPQLRDGRFGQDRRASFHGRDDQPRRCRAGLRPRPTRGRSSRLYARAPHQRLDDLVLHPYAVGLLHRIRWNGR